SFLLFFSTEITIYDIYSLSLHDALPILLRTARTTSTSNFSSVKRYVARSRKNCTIISIVDSSVAPYTAQAFSTSNSSLIFQLFASSICNTPFACLRNPWGSCEPDGISPTEKQPAIVSNLSAILTTEPSTVSGNFPLACNGR